MTNEFQRSVPHVSSALGSQEPAASVLCSSEEQELKEDLARDYWMKVWDECSFAATILHVTAVLAPSTNFTLTGWRSDHWKRDSWHSSHWRTTDCHRKDESYHGCDGTWSKHHVDDVWNSSRWKTTGWSSVTTITLNRNGSLTLSLRL